MIPETYKFFFELYAQFILLFLGLVLPIIIALISLLPEATKSLSDKYRSEVKQSEDNLRETTKETSQGLDPIKIEKATNELKIRQDLAKKKVDYLNLRKPILIISSSLIGAMVLLIPLFIDGIPLKYNSLIIIFSLLSLIYGLSSLWFLFKILVEATEVSNRSKKDYETKNIELLTTLADKIGGAELFIKPEEIDIYIDQKILKGDVVVNYSINTKCFLAIAVANHSDKMVKNYELGFRFPKEFLIEETSNISSLYINEKEQIVRFRSEIMQGRERLEDGNLTITPLKDGSFTVRGFFKAENVKPLNRSFTLKIAE